MIVLRLLLRFLLVPLGALIALWAASATAIAFHWSDFMRAVQAEAGTSEGALVLALMVGPMFAAQVMMSALAILSPGAVAILIAEAFAIRSWIYHIAGGGLAAWVGSTMRSGVEQPHPFFEEPLLIVGAGLIAGIVYWAVAGWNAGFWRPVFPPPPPRPAQPAPASPSTPPPPQSG